MIEPRCLTEGRVGHLCFRTASSAMEKGFVAPGCIPTMRGEGVGGFRSMASLPARRRLQLQPLLRWFEELLRALLSILCRDLCPPRLA
jgi:hypothetical protein